jgi:hypothetical protein
MAAPQIVTQEFGRHNADLHATSARILKGGSWKKQRVIKIVPSADMMATKVAFSHECLVYPPNQGVFRMLALGQEVGDAYSNAIEQVLAHPDLRQWEYILTVESDNVPPPDGVIKLIEAIEENPQYGAISGCYFTKGAGGLAQIWGSVDDPVINFRPQVPRPGQLQECCGIGMGFAIWKIKMFADQRLPRPLFKTKAGREGVGTQDLSFAGEARKLGYRFAVDCRVLVGHYDLEGKFGPPDTMW